MALPASETLCVWWSVPCLGSLAPELSLCENRAEVGGGVEKKGEQEWSGEQGSAEAPGVDAEHSREGTGSVGSSGEVLQAWAGLGAPSSWM